MTRIGLGLAALGRPAYITLGRDRDLGPERTLEAMERRCHVVLEEAFGAGIRYVDVARSYGEAEGFLAAWLRRRRLRPGTVVVGSKWGYTYVGGWRLDVERHEVKDHSVGVLRRQLAESRALLGEHLSLYQVHSATPESGVLEDRAVLDELARLRVEGLTVGITVTGPRQKDTIRRALEVEVDGTSPFSSVQATWNVLEPSAGPALIDAHDAGWGVIVKEAVANGRLTRHGSRSVRSALARAAPGAALDAVAVAAVYQQPWADVVLSGAVTAEQLRSNLSALELSMPTDGVSELLELAEPPERYWRERSALPWR